MEAQALEAHFDWGETLSTLDAGLVRLRWISQADLPAMYEIFSDPRVMRYWSCEPQTDPAQARSLIDEIHDLFARRILFQWGIARTEDDRLIGTCTLHRLEAAHRRAEVGFVLAYDHWGRGYATSAVGALLRFAFETLQLRRLEADTDPRNEPALRLLERHGFKREGLLRERFQVNGELQDSVFLGLLRREWHRNLPTAIRGHR